MSKRIFLYLFLASIMMACTESSNKVKVINLFDSGKNYVDKTVTVDATIMHICKHGGKKMFIAGKDLDKLVKVVPGEGIEKFDAELEGEEITIKGVVKKMIITESAQDQHEKEHSGEATAEHCDTESKTACSEKEFYYVECESFTVKE